ncbi:MAG: hypothetical protein WC045_03130 [Patescibacteria group bacterium]
MVNPETQYCFILGKNSALALAEISATLYRNGISFVAPSITREYAIIKVSVPIPNASKIMEQLGGTIKIIRIVDSFTEKNLMDGLLHYGEGVKSDGKYVFGMSWYNCPHISSQRKQKLAFEIKKVIKEKYSVRLVIAQKDNKLSSAEIHHNKLITKGAEICIINDSGNIALGETEAIQDFERYSLRDYDKPERDAKSGMLPPKLAQIMLGLIPEKYTQIYDPFCGTGTVLGEALIQNKVIYGSDLSQEACDMANKNITFLSKHFDIDQKNIHEALQGDATNISLEFQNKKPTWIVSEMYLGQAFYKEPPLGIVEQEVKNQTDLFIRFLKNIASNTSHIAGFVMAVPFYTVAGKSYFLPILDEIRKLGYTIRSPFKGLLITSPDQKLREYIKNRESILYRREDQVVGREIIIITKDNA